MLNARPWGMAIGRLPLAFLLCLLLFPVRAGERKSYSLAIVPNQPTVTLHKAWAPLAERLSREIAAPVELKLYDTMPAFLAACQAGRPDFIYISPNLFALVHKSHPYIPLVRSSHRIRGQVFVRKDSPYHQVRDLKGKTIAFIGPTSVCSVLTQRALATGQGAIGYNAEFSGSSINVAKSVLLGKVDAGVMLDASLLADLPDRDQIRVLMETDPIAPHPLAAHPRVPAEVQKAVTRAVFAMAGGEPGRSLLAAVKLTDPVKADFKQDYAHFDDPASTRFQSPTP